MRHALLMLLCLALLTACDSTDSSEPTGAVQPVTARDLQIVTGQTVYIPAYAELFIDRDGQTLDLVVTLAIHNSDVENSIIIQSVRYYGTDGELVRDYIREPLAVPPMGTTGFVVDDDSAGWGANFLVEWVAETPVHEPVIEAIMVHTRSAQGISMISPGRVVSQIYPEEGE